MHFLCIFLFFREDLKTAKYAQGFHSALPPPHTNTETGYREPYINSWPYHPYLFLFEAMEAQVFLA